jgi:hypothetical protein
MKTSTRSQSPAHWNGRRFSVRAVRRHPADCEKLTRALGLLALGQSGPLPPEEPSGDRRPPEGDRS